MPDKRLFQHIAKRLTGLIDNGVFPPGTRLPSERELAERFKVSRVTIRDAEIALQAIGRIEIKPGTGVYVCEEQPAQEGHLPEVTAFEVTEARSLVEAEAASLAAMAMSDEGIEKLEDLITVMANSDTEASLAADREFHSMIAEASGNGALIHIIKMLWRMRDELPEVRHSHETVCAKDSEMRSLEHRNILNALKARDPDAARIAMKQHFFRLIDAMLVATEQEALQQVRQRATASRKRYLPAEIELPASNLKQADLGR